MFVGHPKIQIWGPNFKYNSRHIYFDFNNCSQSCLPLLREPQDCSLGGGAPWSWPVRSARIGFEGICGTRFVATRSIRVSLINYLYSGMSDRYNLVPGTKQTIGERNSSWNYLRFINLQRFQRIVLLSFTTVCRIPFWVDFRVSIGPHADFDRTSGSRKKYFGIFFLLSKCQV